MRCLDSPVESPLVTLMIRWPSQYHLQQPEREREREREGERKRQNKREGERKRQSKREGERNLSLGDSV